MNPLSLMLPLVWSWGFLRGPMDLRGWLKWLLAIGFQPVHVFWGPMDRLLVFSGLVRSKEENSIEGKLTLFWAS